MTKQVAASILGIEHKSDKINQLVTNGVNWIHYDVMDGLFVQNTSLPLEEVEFILKHTSKHIVDIHLMVNDPYYYIKLLRGKFDYITFHYEAESIERIEKIMRDFGRDYNVGIAINPQTNVEQIYQFLPDVSHVLVMSVTPGKGGQKFQEKVLAKVSKIKSYLAKIKKDDVFIQIDGGINNQTGPLATKAGASVLVSGSFLLQNFTNKKTIKEILG